MGVGCQKFKLKADTNKRWGNDTIFDRSIHKFNCWYKLSLFKWSVLMKTFNSKDEKNNYCKNTHKHSYRTQCLCTVLTNLTTESTFCQNCYNPFIPFVFYLTCYVEQVFLFKIYFLLGV